MGQQWQNRDPSEVGLAGLQDDLAFPGLVECLAELPMQTSGLFWPGAPDMGIRKQHEGGPSSLVPDQGTFPPPSLSFPMPSWWSPDCHLPSGNKHVSPLQDCSKDLGGS